MSNITDFKTLSFSKASSFNDCEKKFSFSYIEKIRTKSGIHAAVGTFVHQVIEDFFNQKNFLQLMLEDVDKELGYLTKTFDTNWKKHSSMLSKLYAEESRTPEEFKSLDDWIKTLIKNYIELEHFLSNNKESYPDLFLDNSVSILNEIRFTKDFEYPEDNEKIESFELQGYIDRLVLKNEPDINKQFSCSIVDIKTAKPSNYGNSDKKDQIKTYQFLVTRGKDKKSQETKSFIVTNGYLFFLGGKDIDPEKRVLKVDGKEFEKIDTFIEHKFEKTLENILVKRNFDIEIHQTDATTSPWKTKPQILCAWCDYKSVCDEWVKNIIQKDSIKPANIAFKKIRHIGGTSNLKTLQKNKFYRLFDNSQKIIDQIVLFFEEELKPELILYQELLKNVSSNSVVEPSNALVLKDLKKFLKLANSDDELIKNEIKKIMLIILKDDKENIWDLITEGINLINNNRENIQNINYDEFDEFVNNSRKIWKQAQSEVEKDINPLLRVIECTKKFEDFKLFNFTTRSKIKNFEVEIIELSSNIESLSLALDMSDDLHNLVQRNKEIISKCNIVLKLLKKYQNNLKNFESIKV